MDFSNCTVLIVDDTETNIDILVEALSGDFQISVAMDGERALSTIDAKIPDVILLDIIMPGMDGYEVCARLKSDTLTKNIPIIFITAMSEAEDEAKGLSLGAVDYITKPFSPELVRARVQNQLELKIHRDHLEEMVKKRTSELEASQRSAIFMMGEAGHYNDMDTGEHIWRMAAYSSAIAECRGWSPNNAELLELAAPMHDTGKIGIPDAILKKPGKLNEMEWEIMKTHSAVGHSILTKSETPLFCLAAEIALYHLEKWDGSGYPEGLKGENIPESARIVAIGDVFDALTMKRPYKEAWSIEAAFAEIKKNSGSHFDPLIVECFFIVEKQIRDIKDQWGS